MREKKKIGSVFPLGIKYIESYGITKRAICYKMVSGFLDWTMTGHTILEPTATPKLRVSLSLTETVTAVTCSKNDTSVVRMNLECIHIAHNPCVFGITNWPPTTNVG